jgi:hypothetical protein
VVSLNTPEPPNSTQPFQAFLFSLWPIFSVPRAIQVSISLPSRAVEGWRDPNSSKMRLTKQMETKRILYPPRWVLEILWCLLGSPQLLIYNPIDSLPKISHRGKGTSIISLTNIGRNILALVDQKTSTFSIC